MDFLFDIPILGIAIQFVDYMIRVMTINGAVILALAAPIALGALCGFMNERSGIVNIGIEGMMIAAAFAGWFVASAVVQLFPEQPKADWFFGAGISSPVRSVIATGIALVMLLCLPAARRGYITEVMHVCALASVAESPVSLEFLEG